MKKTLLYFILCFSLFTSLNTYAQAWVVVGNTDFITSPSYTGIAIDTGGTPYVVGTGSAELMKFNGVSWISVGMAASPYEATGTSMAIDKSGNAYVAYVDYGDSEKASVMKYNGGSWVTVGSRGFSATGVGNTAIAIDTAGTLYVAYPEYAGKATVMKYNGSDWVTVGSNAFTAGAANYLSIAISNSGTPYVVYEDGGNNNFATVMMYKDSSWVTVGSPAFSDSSVLYTSIAIDTGGTPFVAYQDAADNQGATVMKYNGSSWVPVGLTGFSAACVEWPSIAIDKSGTLYVAYMDCEYGLKATVMTYIGAWVPVGNPGFTEAGGMLVYCTMTIDNNGIPYVLYDDGASCSVSKLDTAIAPINGPTIICKGAPVSLSELKGGGTWSCSNSTVATIDTNGVVTGLWQGEATISYTKGGSSATFTIFVDSLPSVTMATYDIDSLCRGDSMILSPSLASSWSTVTGTWSSLDTSIATVFNPVSWGDYWFLSGKAIGEVPLEYIATNSCGTDTTIFSFWIDSCGTEVKYTIASGSYELYPATKLTVTSATFVIYPNPATAKLTISSPDTIQQVTIFDVLGQTIYSDKYNAEQVQVDVSGFAAGVYFVKVNGVEVRKFVKE